MTQKTAFDCDFGLNLGKFALHAKFCTNSQALGIFGASGTGKTSILHAVAGIHHPKEGHIKIGGETWFDSQTRQNTPIQARKIGLVFQDAQLFVHKSVMDNLCFGYRNVASEDRQFHPDEIIDLLKLSHLTKRMPNKLSGGEKQRVALGRALLYSPRLLLMDEPLSALDSEHKVQILHFFKQIKEQTGIPMLYVSHDMTEIEFLTDEVYQL